VQRRALRHFARTRHALDSIEGKEVALQTTPSL
jgi:hypothetical protein